MENQKRFNATVISHKARLALRPYFLDGSNMILELHKLTGNAKSADMVSPDR